MCGYTNESITTKPSTEDILKQFDYAMTKYTTQTKVLKIFTSGSFFDKREIPEDAQYMVLEKAKEKFKKIIVETRSEFVTENMLMNAKDKAGNLELAIGLESSNDKVLKYSINKGSNFIQFKNACMLANKAGVTIKAYVLVKPPFLTEREAYYDAYATVKDISGIENLTTISFNPVNIQSYTLVERMYSRGEYRPPWLWTVVKVLCDSKEYVGERIRLISSPTAGGTSRGAYNCEKCNSKVLDAIRKFSIKQDVQILKKSLEDGCECKEAWLDVLDLEGFMQSSVPLE
jgi:radical SAM enzyme (TIGR01210 family)